MPIDDTLLDDLLNEEIHTSEHSANTVLVADRDRSIKFSVIGLGQAGSRLAECFYGFGYAAVALNTAAQDLSYIKIPQNKKMLLDIGFAGAGKDLDRGASAIEQYKEQVAKFIQAEALGDNDMFLVCASGGGGSGSGSLQPMMDLLSQFNKPIGVIYVLPLHTDDAQSKKNSLITLAKLARASKNNIISTLLVVDNSKIEALLQDTPQTKFWDEANNAIVKPIHIFNTLTMQASQFTSLDQSDFAKIITTGDLSLVGTFAVENYEQETDLAEAVMKSFSANMLADGFNLKEARAGGVIVVGRKTSLDKVSATSINYMYHMISEATDSASIYRGVYAADTKDDKLYIYSWIAGLGLPVDRINVLKQESAAVASKAEEKEKSRNMTMSLDVGEQTINAAQEINKKIQQKNSGFNKLIGGGIVDRRKK